MRALRIGCHYQMSNERWAQEDTNMQRKTDFIKLNPSLLSLPPEELCIPDRLSTRRQ